MPFLGLLDQIDWSLTQAVTVRMAVAFTLSVIVIVRVTQHLKQ